MRILGRSLCEAESAKFGECCRDRRKPHNRLDCRDSHQPNLLITHRKHPLNGSKNFSFIACVNEKRVPPILNKIRSSTDSWCKRNGTACHGLRRRAAESLIIRKVEEEIRLLEQ